MPDELRVDEKALAEAQMWKGLTALYLDAPASVVDSLRYLFADVMRSYTLPAPTPNKIDPNWNVDAELAKAQSATPRPEVTAEFIAGMLSTLDFRPAERHPSDCLPMARCILTALQGEK